MELAVWIVALPLLLWVMSGGARWLARDPQRRRKAQDTFEAIDDGTSLRDALEGDYGDTSGNDGGGADGGND